jgi:regulator of sigma D
MKTIELTNGYVLEGVDKNLDKVLELVNRIESEMKETYDDSLSYGDESRAMDDRDDVVYEYETELEELGWGIQD